MRGVKPGSPALALAQLAQLQFHCGKPPPAADPNTFMIMSESISRLRQWRRGLGNALAARPSVDQNPTGLWALPAAHLPKKDTAADASTAVPSERACRGFTTSLDDVDLSRQVARNLEPNFLLTNLRLVPNLHDFLRCFSSNCVRHCDACL